MTFLTVTFLPAFGRCDPKLAAFRRVKDGKAFGVHEMSFSPQQHE